MCDYVFSKLGLNYQDYIVQNQKFLRPEELKYLKGDSSKIRALGWSPEFTFESLMDDMIDHWIKIYKK
jgi:GDPmannose 4,6-dehydratase